MLKSIIKSVIVTVLIGLLLNYFFLPAWTLESQYFWVYILFLLIIFISNLAIQKLNAYGSETEGVLNKLSLFASISLIAGIVLFIILSISSSKLVNSRGYADMLESYIKQSDISEYKATLDNVPLLDKDSAIQICNRELGGLTDVVSQFEMGSNEQITMKGKPMRVSPLYYGGLFKWNNNRHSGTPGYIKIDMQTQDAELVRVNGGLRYTPSEYFSRDVNRYLRKNYPTYIFDEPTFELNEEGHPYWIAPIVKHTIGLFGGKDIRGIVVLDAVTGGLEEYAVGKIPDWVDNVYSSRLIMEQYDNYGSFQKGFWNAVFGQQGVIVTTDGYNYIPQENDNWIYTGVTSVAKDESNIGFILTNKRTKETIYYPISGAEEYSAMTSAQGVVQHMGYTSTFPLLLNIEGQPTYLVALKDNGGLVKMYGMINVEKYQIVATANTVEGCKKEYRKLLSSNGTVVEQKGVIDMTGVIEDIRTANKEGTTYYYVKLEGNEKYYSLNILDNEETVLLNVGNSIKLMVLEEKEDLIVPAILK